MINSIEYTDENTFVEEVREELKNLGLKSLMDASLDEVVEFLIDAKVFKDEDSAKAFLIHNSLDSILKQEYDFPINIKLNEEDLDTGCIYYREASI